MAITFPKFFRTFAESLKAKNERRSEIPNEVFENGIDIKQTWYRQWLNESYNYLYGAINDIYRGIDQYGKPVHAVRTWSNFEDFATNTRQLDYGYVYTTLNNSWNYDTLSHAIAVIHDGIRLVTVESKVEHNSTDHYASYTETFVYTRTFSPQLDKNFKKVKRYQIELNKSPFAPFTNGKGFDSCIPEQTKLILHRSQYHIFFINGWCGNIVDDNYGELWHIVLDTNFSELKKQKVLSGNQTYTVEQINALYKIASNSIIVGDSIITTLGQKIYSFSLIDYHFISSVDVTWEDGIVSELGLTKIDEQKFLFSEHKTDDTNLSFNIAFESPFLGAQHYTRTKIQYITVSEIGQLEYDNLNFFSTYDGFASSSITKIGNKIYGKNNTVVAQINTQRVFSFSYDYISWIIEDDKQLTIQNPISTIEYLGRDGSIDDSKFATNIFKPNVAWDLSSLGSYYFQDVAYSVQLLNPALPVEDTMVIGLRQAPSKVTEQNWNFHNRYTRIGLDGYARQIYLLNSTTDGFLFYLFSICGNNITQVRQIPRIGITDNNNATVFSDGLFIYIKQGYHEQVYTDPNGNFDAISYNSVLQIVRTENNQIGIVNDKEQTNNSTHTGRLIQIRG